MATTNVPLGDLTEPLRLTPKSGGMAVSGVECINQRLSTTAAMIAMRLRTIAW